MVLAVAAQAQWYGGYGDYYGGYYNLHHPVTFPQFTFPLFAKSRTVFEPSAKFKRHVPVHPGPGPAHPVPAQAVGANHGGPHHHHGTHHGGKHHGTHHGGKHHGTHHGTHHGGKHP